MKNQGFSLVELLTVIVIIGILSTIGLVAYTKFAKDNKITLDQNMAKTIIDATEAYCSNPKNMTACGIYKVVPPQDSMLITLKTLVDEELIEGELKNHALNKPFCLEETIVTVTPTSAYNYDYVFNVDNPANFSCSN